ncbi:MAG: hypothetical protein JXR37_34405 [Kiritimatiellae bacterium]|nr:hypothetical protein [Kiritimatiellia bacterium]
MAQNSGEGATGRSLEGARLDCWIEWKQRCALDLCSDDSRRELQGYAFHRFRRLFLHYARSCAEYAEQAAYVEPGRVGDLAPARTWHLFESHLQIKTTRAGKRYKDWLFARTRFAGGSVLDAVQGGASLIMRDVVREWLRREFSPKNMVSLHAAVMAEDGTRLTLEDLLPGSVDPSSEMALREYERLARQHARDAFGQMSRRERVAFLAKALGLSLMAQDVQRAAGCSRSVLRAEYLNRMQTISDRLKSVYPDEDGDGVLRLLRMTLSELRDMVFDWGRRERGCSPVFNRIGDGVHRGELAVPLRAASSVETEVET